MTSWPSPALPKLPGLGIAPRIFDSTRGEKVLPPTPDGRARMYVCGITPYDATHVGHAATYIAFDLVNRAWRDAGLTVSYVQNVTDVDDPLLERAAATGVDWHDLAAEQVSLFAQDMTALGVLAPEVYVGVTDAVPSVVNAVRQLLEQGHAYRVPVQEDGEPLPGEGDVYFAVRSDPRFGQVGGLDEATMRTLFAERGGDPDRPGKKDPLDCLLWRQERAGEPAWDGGVLGRGRPGWHIECTAIALDHLGMGFDVQGGGNDLLFPHHEMGAAQAHALTGSWPFAQTFVHSGMVALDGQKMSKSRGNLVFVSKLRQAGVDPAAIRLAVLAHHYRSNWEWTGTVLQDAEARLHRWREALSRQNGPDPTETLAQLREHLADDLDAPAALRAMDTWVDHQLKEGGDQEGAPGVLGRAADALLGIRL